MCAMSGFTEYYRLRPPRRVQENGPKCHFLGLRSSSHCPAALPLSVPFRRLLHRLGIERQHFSAFIICFRIEIIYTKDKRAHNDKIGLNGRWKGFIETLSIS